MARTTQWHLLHVNHTLRPCCNPHPSEYQFSEYIIHLIKSYILCLLTFLLVYFWSLSLSLLSPRLQGWFLLLFLLDPGFFSLCIVFTSHITGNPHDPFLFMNYLSAKTLIQSVITRAIEIALFLCWKKRSESHWMMRAKSLPCDHVTPTFLTIPQLYPITFYSVAHCSPSGPQILQMPHPRAFSLTRVIISHFLLVLVWCFQWAAPWIRGHMEYIHLLSQSLKSLTDSHSWLLSLLQLIILKIACFVDVSCLLFIVCLHYLTREQESESPYHSFILPGT